MFPQKQSHVPSRQRNNGASWSTAILCRIWKKKKDAADYELLKVLKEDDRRSKYKNNVVIVGGDHLHVKYLQFCQDRHKRNNVMLLYTQALKVSVGNVLNTQISLRDFLQLPPPTKQAREDIASGKMDSYRDGQRAKKGRKEQGRKARKQEQKLDEAETDFEMGMEAEVVLNINQEVV